MRLRIKEILKEKDKTATWLAEKIRITQPSMSNIINEKAKTSLETLQKIAIALEVDFLELFESDGISGFVKSDGIIHEIKSISDMENILSELKRNLEKQTETEKQTEL